MSQPQYETEKDLASETAFAEKMQFATGARLKKLKKNYIIDFVIIRGKKCCGYIEYKRRWNKHDKYDTIFVATSKWLELCRLSLMSKSFFYIEYNDCIKYIEVTPAHYDLPAFDMYEEFSGRVDRGDEYDQEPCIHLPINHLKTMAL
jgi:hypothetical protein